jgi:hypothetical protein
MVVSWKNIEDIADASRRPIKTSQAGSTTILVIVIGFLLLALGLVRGDAHQVWLRAVQVCLGCIGIG